MYLPDNLAIDWDALELQQEMFEKFHLGDCYLEDDDWSCAEVAEEREAAHSIHDGFFIRDDGERFHAIILVEKYQACVKIYYTESQQTIDSPNELVFETFQETFEPIGDNSEALVGIKQWCIGEILNL